MTGRKLGGGRILGSGRALGPPKPASLSPSTSLVTSPALSNSTLGFPLSSVGSTPKKRSAVVAAALAATRLPGEGGSGGGSRGPSEFGGSPMEGGFLAGTDGDLGSRVVMGDESGGKAEEGGLLCPICNEEMMTLLQLNRHIDDEHQELPAVAQDEVRTWFDKQVSKAKRFQPLSLINQKLRGLEVFESNGSTSGSYSNTAVKFPEGMVEPDELITRAHWQRVTGNDYCTDPTCEQRFGPLNASINCRKCGKLFCERHTMYQIKLSRSAAHEPVRGVWARVCETCYVSREGYNDHHGTLTDHTGFFKSVRSKKVNRHNLETTRLEKRLTKLTRLLAVPSEDLPQTTGPALLSQKAARKAIEQSIVTWEDDASVLRCPFCLQEFGSWTFRRHHCRMCGKVVCADGSTGCSKEIGLNVANPVVMGEKGGRNIAVDVRMCRDCMHTLFARRDFAAALAVVSPSQRAYETLKKFEEGIRLLIPRFQRALVALHGRSGEEILPSHAQIQEAGKIRKRLIDAFTKYDAAARRLRDMKTNSLTEERLQKTVYAGASTFLHTHMLTLKSVPNILRNSPNSGTNTPGTPSRPQAASSLRHASPAPSTSASVSATASALSTIETEEKEIREQLIVLEEQRFMVQQMIDSAHGGRRFEEVSALTRNKEELEKEIDKLRGEVGQVEERWHEVYREGEEGA